MGGKIDKGMGKVKEQAGKLTDNERLESEGKAQHIKGHIKEGTENVKDAWQGTKDGLKE